MTVLEQYVNFGHTQMPQNMLFALYAKHGRSFAFDKKSLMGTKRTLGKCYERAGRLRLEAEEDSVEITYVEGFVAFHGIPIAHGFCVTAEGKVIDPTLPKADFDHIGGYFGVPLSHDYVCRRLLATKKWGILCNLRSEDDLPTDEEIAHVVPVEAVAV